jgi:CheY-like chemotaxis protein
MDVLLIDDNKEITEMISFFLDTQYISCKVVNDGKESLERIRNEKYDIILLDLTLPMFSGYDVFDYLKKNDLLKQNNIILFTASYITDEEIQKMMTDGAKGILKKPVSIEAIIETINRFK